MKRDRNCTRCHEWTQAESLSADGCRCKKCATKEQKAYYYQAQKIAGHILTPEHSWKSKILRRYGLTAEEYTALLEEQDNACAICRKEETQLRNGKPIRLTVDHDHASGEVRGLLCGACNRAIGLLKDDAEVARAATTYLEMYANVQF